MSEAQDAVVRLEASLAEHGEPVIVRRGVTDIATVARCRTIKATEVVTRSGSAQATAKAILSPTAIAALLPLRTTDKFVRGGQERTVVWAETVKYGTEAVRVNLEFIG